MFIPHKLAFKLKEKNFHDKCIAWYLWDNNNYSKMTPKLKTDYNDYNSEEYFKARGYGSHNEYASAPTYQQVVDWLRENHNIDIFPIRDMPRPHNAWKGVIIYQLNGEDKHEDVYPKLYKGCVESGSYYEAYDCVIEKALELI